jgi:hypothetical protein
VRGGELLASAEEEISWVWEPFLPSGTLAVLAAFMKIGKSTLAYSLLIAIAQGRPFLGFATKKGGVLILAVEEHRRDVRLRLRRFGMRNEDPIWVHEGPLPSDGETLKQVKDFVVKQEIRVVLLDTLTSFWNVADENDNSKVIKVLKPLLKLARETEAVILLAHHERKAGGEGGRSIRGAGGLLGLVDQAIILERRQGGKPNQRVLRTLGRYAESPAEVLIELVGDEYQCLGKPEDSSRTAEVGRVLGALSEKAQTMDTIANRSLLTPRMVSKILSTELKNQVVVAGSGKKGKPFTYRLRGLENSGLASAPKGVNGPETNPPESTDSIPDHVLTKDLGPERDGDE